MESVVLPEKWMEIGCISISESVRRVIPRVFKHHLRVFTRLSGFRSLALLLDDFSCRPHILHTIVLSHVQVTSKEPTSNIVSAHSTRLRQVRILLHPLNHAVRGLINPATELAAKILQRDRATSVVRCQLLEQCLKVMQDALAGRQGQGST